MLKPNAIIYFKQPSDITESPFWVESMNDYEGKPLTFRGYSPSGYIKVTECEWQFSPNWLDKHKENFLPKYFALRDAIRNAYIAETRKENRTMQSLIRAWYFRETNNSELHPIINKLLADGEHPQNMHLLTLEHPHESLTIKGGVAYTQNDEKGNKDVQTATRLGKYIKRHFPQLSDDKIRDYVALHIDSEFKILTSMDEIIEVMTNPNSPRSCMLWDSDNKENHPYRAYDTAYNWGLAVLTKGDEVIARALVNTKNKTFCRTFKKNTEGTTQTDEQLTSLLKDKGYSKTSGWAGDKLAKIKIGHEWLLPYIDGNNQGVIDRGGYWEIADESEAEYICNNTNGTADENHSNECEDCGDRISEDNCYYATYHEERCVCESCLNRNYTYIADEFSDQGHSYYAPDDEVSEVIDSRGSRDGHIEDGRAPSDYVELSGEYEGKYTHMDNAYLINGEFYHCTDGDVVQLAIESNNGDSFALIGDCWQSESGKYYLDDEHEAVEINGKLYHAEDDEELIEELQSEDAEKCAIEYSEESPDTNTKGD